MLEMYRRDRFREDLLAEHCAELVGLEARLQEIDSLITTGTTTGAVVARCDCGAPIVSGSHFCANCGRPTGEAAVLECGNCGHPLPADAVFCASCGTPAAATMVGHGRSAARDDRGSESESPS